MERRPSVRIRAARTDEAAALSQLSQRSKAYWGYDRAFLDACADELRIHPSALNDTRQLWRVAVHDSRIAGVYGLVPMDADSVELEALFVEPDAIGAGTGACLVADALREARARGYRRMIIQGDPHATGFYTAMGAAEIGERESASIPGRFLPLFELVIPEPRQAIGQETLTVSIPLVNQSRPDDWPELPWSKWSDTAATLHLWTQIVGKIRLTRMPWCNHSWHVALYPTARGLSTGPIAFGGRTAELRFDFIEHQLVIELADGNVRHVSLRDRSVADFYRAVMENFKQLELDCTIHTTPSEIADAIPFHEDETHHHYDPEYANRFHRAMLQVHRVFTEFRARFRGKVSPVHFFWGSFDLAVTRFSGRDAPVHPGGVPNFPDWVAAEAYSHEVSSAGFWPGGGGIDYPAFYSYAYPAPDGFAAAAIAPEEAFFSSDLGEFILPYDAVKTAASPDTVLLEFLHSTYDAAAELGHWDREALERPPGGFGPG